MMKSKFFFSVLVQGWKPEESNELLESRINNLKADKHVSKENFKMLKHPLSYYDSHPKNIKINEEEQKSEKKRTKDELVAEYVYRKDCIIDLEFENLQDYFWTIVRHNPDYAEILEAEGWDEDKIYELNSFVGVVLDGQRKIVAENGIMMGIIKKKCPEVLSKESSENGEEKE